MRHLIASLALVSVPLATPLIVAQDIDPPVAPNYLRHEPSLALEIRSGFGVSQILLSNDGAWSHGWVSRDDSSFQVGHADPEVLRSLMGDLEQVGAVELLDQVGGPHSNAAWTLTLLYGETDAEAHTMTWYHGESPDHVLVQGRVSDYLATELGILLPN